MGKAKKGADTAVDEPVAVDPTVSEAVPADPAIVLGPSTATLSQRLDTLLAAVEDLTGKVDILWAQQANLEKATSQLAGSDVPDTALYQCQATTNVNGVDVKCEYTVEAVHPRKWWAGYGPIECPRHPGRPDTMLCLDLGPAEPSVVSEGSGASATPQPLPPPGAGFQAPAGAPVGALPPVPSTPEAPAEPAPQLPDTEQTVG